MYGKCERCGSVDGAGMDLGGKGGVPAMLCVKCRRTFDNFIHGTAEWKAWVTAADVLDEAAKRAEASDPRDALWDALKVTRLRYRLGAENLREKVLAWVKVNCDEDKVPDMPLQEPDHDD